MHPLKKSTHLFKKKPSTFALRVSHTTRTRHARSTRARFKMNKTPVAKTIAYRSVADRVRCARYFTEVLCDHSADSTLWQLQSNVIHKYSNAGDRHVALVRELLCQTPTSPLYELAMLWDHVETLSVSPYVMR